MANVIYIGESKTLQFSIKNANGNPSNLTGATASWRLAENFVSSPLITKNAVVSNPVGGIITVNLEEADTDDLDAGKYIYELVIELDGNTIVASQGTIDILSALF